MKVKSLEKVKILKVEEVSFKGRNDENVVFTEGTFLTDSGDVFKATIDKELTIQSGQEAKLVFDVSYNDYNKRMKLRLVSVE